MRMKALMIPALAGAVVAGCDRNPAAAPVSEAPAASPVQTPTDALFARAGQEFGVPAGLLKAVSYAETAWHMAPGEKPEFEGQAPVWGLMGLSGAQLDRAASLAGLSVSTVRTDPLSNVRAGAALLRAYADELKIDRGDLGAWAPAVAKFSGISDPAGQALYVEREVYGPMRQGVPASALSPTTLQATLGPNPSASPRLPQGSFSRSASTMTADYGPATWYGNGNANFGSRGGATPKYLVIHTCAGADALGCIDYMNSPSVRLSAHYAVSTGGSVYQMVSEANAAYHTGASWQGTNTNANSIGIEHGGTSFTQSNIWPAAQVTASVNLACDIVVSHGIIRDRNHVIGHYQPDPANKAQDPGNFFPWGGYMWRIEDCANGAAVPSWLVYKVTMRTNSGSHFLSAEGHAPGEAIGQPGGLHVGGFRTGIGVFESLYLKDLNAGTLESGDYVNIAPRNYAWWFVAEGGGSSGTSDGRVNANRRAAGEWERFRIWKVNGSGGTLGGTISRTPGSGQNLVALQSSNGRFVNVEFGGGQTYIYANRAAHGPWETFALEDSQ
ncbi:MAG TPA: peptidoglycan recognition family protein [Longimicrobiaceae bacterium]